MDAAKEAMDKHNAALFAADEAIAQKKDEALQAGIALKEARMSHSALKTGTTASFSETIKNIQALSKQKATLQSD